MRRAAAACRRSRRRLRAWVLMEPRRRWGLLLTTRVVVVVLVVVRLEGRRRAVLRAELARFFRGLAISRRSPGLRPCSRRPRCGGAGCWGPWQGQACA